MTKPPPQDLMEWPKAQLAAEVARLRAILHQYGDRSHDDPRSGGETVDVVDDPHYRGGVVLDTRGAILLDYNEVTLVDTNPEDDERLPAIAMVLEGRVNLKAERVRQMYLFGTDGAAAFVAQIVGLASRAGGRFAVAFRDDLEHRLDELP